MEKENIEFRKKINNIITDKNNFLNIQSIETIFSEDGKGIVLLKEYMPNSVGNCYSYALGLAIGKDLETIPLMNMKIIISDYLVEDDDGVIIVYFNGSQPEHAGVYRDNHVISRWGGGHVWRHDLWDVPEIYGNKYVRYRINDDLKLREYLRESKFV